MYIVLRKALISSVIPFKLNKLMQYLLQKSKENILSMITSTVIILYFIRPLYLIHCLYQNFLLSDGKIKILYYNETKVYYIKEKFNFRTFFYTFLRYSFSIPSCFYQHYDVSYYNHTTMYATRTHTMSNIVERMSVVTKKKLDQVWLKFST